MIRQKEERLIAIPWWMVIIPKDDERRIKLEVELGLAAMWLLYHNEEIGNGEEEKIKEEN